MNGLEKRQLQRAFETFLPLPVRLDRNLEQALRHVLRHAGSLVRPQIVLRISEAYGLPQTGAMELAIALEYFHTASLLFDDLPCMDNASERRGAPCVHVRFGEAEAMLAALAIINRAYALAWRAASACAVDRRARGLEYLEQHLGVGGLLNGQSLDLHYAGMNHDLETTQRVACGKTVSLIRLTLVLPALLSGAPPSELRLLERIALYWGLAYQIVDDLKDVLQSSAESGKSERRDLSLDRPNVALAIGVTAALTRLDRLIAIGDHTLVRLLARRPSLTFLSSLREGLLEETARVTRESEAGCGA